MKKIDKKYYNEVIENSFKNDSGGFKWAYRWLRNAYIGTAEKQASMFTVDDLTFAYDYIDDLKEFRNVLIQANIDEFILTTKSTGLMESLFALESIGCKMVGLDYVTIIDMWEENEIKIQGIKFKVQ